MNQANVNPEPPGGKLPAPSKADIIPAQEWMRSQRQIQLVRETLTPTLNDNEFEMFLGVCRATGLNPIMRQLHAIKRRDKNAKSGYRVCYQMGIDGYRLLAQRSGGYAGSDEPEFFGTENRPPSKARVTVYKIVGGVRCPFTATAYWAEYYPSSQSDAFMWDKMPHGQLAKCAEALALRKAFPAELSGLYVDAELDQAEVWVDAEPIQQPKRTSEAQNASTGHDPAPSQPVQEKSHTTYPDSEGGSQGDSGAVHDHEPHPEERTEGPDWSKPGWRQVTIEAFSDKPTKAKGKPKWSIKVNGYWANTFDRSLGEFLAQAYRGQWALWVRLEKNGDFLNVMEAFRP